MTDITTDNITEMSNAELDAVVADADAQLGDRMMTAVYQFIGRFVAYPSDHAQVAHALWITHCHLMQKWDSTPRIAFLSPEPGSGKTRALEVTELLVPNPVTAVNVSPAYLFRKVGEDNLSGDTNGAVILHDEIDTVFGPKAKENEEIRELLNAGHRRGAVAGRCTMRGKTVVPEEIPAYAAVALAGLGWLPDTILSRAVIIRMRRRHQGEHVEQFRRRIHVVEGRQVFSMIAAWARTVTSEITWPDMPAGIEDRDADVWESLLAVADLVGGPWPQLARDAAVALVHEAKEKEPSLGIRLLADLRTVFGEAEAMASKAILVDLHALPEAPWDDLRGRPLDERGLARHLREYGVKSKNIAIGEARPKGYARADLHDAWTRYLPPPPSPATSATCATDATRPEIQQETVAGIADSVAEAADVLPFQSPKKASKQAAVAGVAHVADLSGDEGEVAALCDHCQRPGIADDPLLEVDDGQQHHLHHTCVGPWRDLDIARPLRRDDVGGAETENQQEQTMRTTTIEIEFSCGNRFATPIGQLTTEQLEGLLAQNQARNDINPSHLTAIRAELVQRYRELEAYWFAVSNDLEQSGDEHRSIQADGFANEFHYLACTVERGPENVAPLRLANARGRPENLG